MSNEKRLIDIELKLTHQEDTVDTLSTLVYVQQKKIDELEKLLLALARQVKEYANRANETDQGNEKPPHY